MSQHIISEIYKIIDQKGHQQSNWSQCRDQESQLQFIHKALIQLFGDDSNQSDYSALEKQVQKYENEIRKHIRMEQQIKLYAESLQSKLEEHESNKHETMQNSKSLINTLKKENILLLEQIQQLRDENQLLKLKLIELHENINGHQTSPSQDRYKQFDPQIKSNSKYSTIDSQMPKSRRYSKVADDSKTQSLQDGKTQISQTIDSSILKVYNQRKDSLKDRRDSDKLESHRLRQFNLQPQPQRTVSSQQKHSQQQQQQQQQQSQQQQQILNNKNNHIFATTTQYKDQAKFELKSQKIADNYKQFLTTYNNLCSKSKSNSRQDNRQKKSISEHNEKRTRDSNFIKHDQNTRINTIEPTKINLDYKNYLENDM